MKKQNSGKQRWIMMSVLVLFVCVSATTIALMSKLNSYQLDNSGAISLISGEMQYVAENQESTDAGEAASDAENVQKSEGAKTDSSTDKETPDSGIVAEGNSESAGAGTVPSTGTITELVNESTGSQSGSSQGGSSQAASGSSQFQANPEFITSDENGWWYTMTEVEIFKISYENGEQVITVNSDNGDKVIAPGTTNSYVFKIDNTGNVPLDYTVEVDAYFIPDENPIPIECRLSRYDGYWIVGNQNGFADVAALDAAVNVGSLGAGKYIYYTLEWGWPFEHGDDAYDTFLGNLAVEEDLTFKIVIKTRATYCDDPNEDSGITPPKMGDTTNLSIWIIVAVVALAFMIMINCYPIKDKQRDKSEAKDS